jgi:hypothetical protein
MILNGSLQTSVAFSDSPDSADRMEVLIETDHRGLTGT